MKKKRGPASAADLAVVATAAPVPRVRPGRALSAAERALWTAAVDGLPGDWFGPEHAPQLVLFVRHQAQALALAERLAELDPLDPAWPKLHAAQIAASKAALAYARSLRLTLASRADRDAATTKARRSGGPASLEQLRARYAMGVE